MHTHEHNKVDQKSIRKGPQFRILNCTIVQYNKTHIDLIFV